MSSVSFVTYLFGSYRFTATTVGEDEFRLLIAELDVELKFTEVDESSLFCEIKPL
jgi:hypothetical protein